MADDPKYGNAKHLAGLFAEAFYDRMLGVGESLEARGDLPTNAEEFATVVSYVVFDQLAGAVMKMNAGYPTDGTPSTTSS